MGSILTALQYQRPIIILPRRARLREHRNDHQLATAKWLRGRQGIYVAWDETQIAELLDRRAELTAGPSVSPHADEQLLQRLRRFIWERS
jgi:UDP-N-acetylglucosamine transferase subunit ALG13